MLKQTRRLKILGGIHPAAFRRLCVETVSPKLTISASSPAAFRRLCVETDEFEYIPMYDVASRL